MSWIRPEVRIANGDSFVSSLCKKMTARALVGDDHGFACLDDNGELVYDNYDIFRQAPSLPTGPIDQFRLFSPRTWWGMIVCEDRSSFSPFDLSTVVRSLVGLLLPILMLWTIDFLHLAILRHQRSMATMSSTGGATSKPEMILGRLIFASMVSPWSLLCIYEVYRQLSIVLKSVRTTLNSRSPTLTRAINVLSKRIRNHRAYRTRRFDVYLPPSLTDSVASGRGKEQSDNILEALLFIPGASVSHQAYSEVAARLSDDDFLVAVMSMEPLRLAHHHFGADRASVKRIMQQITEQIRSHATTSNCLQHGEEHSEIARETPPAITVEWTLMGHSMGSFACMKLLDEFFDAEKDNYGNSKRKLLASKPYQCVLSKNRQMLSQIPSLDMFITNKLVMWGVAAFPDAATDISHHTKAKILMVQGTKDKLVEMMRCRQAELDAYFPPDIQLEEIIGGTHEGFSSYIPPHAFANEDESDSGKKKARAKSLSLDEQHRRACDATVRFLHS